MNNREEIFAEELQRTLQWVSRNPKAWIRINDSCPNETSPEEISEAIDLLVQEKLYIPLTIYLANEFVSYRGADLMRRIVVDVLLSQWNEETWNTAIKAMKSTIVEYLEEQGNPMEK